MALKDHPRLLKVFEELQEERNVLVEKLQPYLDQEARLQAEIQPLQAKLRAVQKDRIAIERPALPEIDTQMAAIARAAGAKLVRKE